MASRIDPRDVELLTALEGKLYGELNVEIEPETAIDTTAGPAKTPGERRAHMADTQ